MVMITQRRTAYAVKDCLHIKDLHDLADLRKRQKKDEAGSRHVYVVKRHNTKTGEDKLFCKIRGFLYLVLGDRVYRVAFINSLQIGVRKLKFC
jgi:hypothetical protein